MRRGGEGDWKGGGDVCLAISTYGRQCAPQLPLLEGSGL